MTAPASAIEAIIYCVKTRGVGALREPSNIERLRRCDATAKRQIDRRIAAITTEGDAAPEEPHRYCDEALSEACDKTTETGSGNLDQRPDKQDDDKKEKQVTVLLAIAETARNNRQGGEPPRQGIPSLFHSPAPDREAYADIIIDGHRETHPVRGRSFKQFLRHQYFRRTQCACNADALKTATETIAAVAEFEGAERPVYCRIAGYDGAIYIDIGDATWRAIKVTTHGWEVIDFPPVRFIRSASTKALSLPQPGGSVAALRPFCNLKSDGEFVLFVAYILATLKPDVNYPVLAVTGDKGRPSQRLAALLRS